MAITFDTSSDSAGKASNSRTWSHTCTGSNQVLIVTAFSTTNLTSCTATYNSVSMTQISSMNTLSGVHSVAMFYLINPTTGANNIVISQTGASLGGIATSYAGVKQTTIDSSNTGSNSASNSITLSTTVVATTAWLISCVTGSGDTPTGGTGTTRRLKDSGGFGIALGDSNANVGSGSQSMTWNINNTGNNQGIIGSFSLNSISNTMTANSGTYSTTGNGTPLGVGKNMSATSGVYATTGGTNLLALGRHMIAQSGTYLLSGSSTLLSYIGRILKSVITKSVVSKSSSSSPTNISKHSSSITNLPKNQP